MFNRVYSACFSFCKYSIRGYGCGMIFCVILEYAVGVMIGSCSVIAGLEFDGGTAAICRCALLTSRNAL